MRQSKVKYLFSKIEYSLIESIDLDSANRMNVKIDVKRDDLLHPILSGNKWRKLKYLLLDIERKGFSKVATMGGGYSNFLHSLAYSCYTLGWSCELFVRGYDNQPITPTLRDCVKWGAKIQFVNKKDFREMRVKSPLVTKDHFWVSEGGIGLAGILGLQEIYMELTKDYDYIVIASATGTSVAGLALAASKLGKNTKVVGISVLNNGEQQRQNIVQLIGNMHSNWSIIEGFEVSGFAKTNEELDKFVINFYHQHKIPLESVYSGKSFLALDKLIKQGYFEGSSKVLLIHCGGLQGKRKI